jgi:hypothetical protein
MAYQSLGIGSSLNDGTGDTLRSGGSKINDNFSEIYTLMGDGESLSSGISSSATVITLTAPTISGAVGGTQTSATITTLTTTTVNGTTLNGGTCAVAAGSITDSSGAISFGNENLTTTGTLTSGNLTCGTITSTGASIVFEGATADAHETTITVTDPTADRTITVPNETGTLLTTGTSDTVDSTMLKSASTLLIVNSSGSTLKTVIGAGS